MRHFSDHPWIREDGDAPDTPLDNAVLNRLKQFRAMNKFKKAALRVSISLSFLFLQSAGDQYLFLNGLNPAIPSGRLIRP